MEITIRYNPCVSPRASRRRCRWGGRVPHHHPCLDVPRRAVRADEHAFVLVRQRRVQRREAGFRGLRHHEPVVYVPVALPCPAVVSKRPYLLPPRTQLSRLSLLEPALVPWAEPFPAPIVHMACGWSAAITPRTPPCRG